MALGKEFVTKIKHKIQDQQESPSHPFSVEWKGHDYLFQAEIREGDRLAAQLRQLTIRRIVKPTLSSEKLDQLIEWLQARVTYLPESLKLVEKDQPKLQAVLRSANPYRHENAVEYFQLWVNATIEISLQRIRNVDGRNEPIPFVINYHLIERFVNDTVAGVNQIVEQ